MDDESYEWKLWKHPKCLKTWKRNMVWSSWKRKRWRPFWKIKKQHFFWILDVIVLQCSLDWPLVLATAQILKRKWSSSHLVTSVRLLPIAKYMCEKMYILQMSIASAAVIENSTTPFTKKKVQTKFAGLSKKILKIAHHELRCLVFLQTRHVPTTPQHVTWTSDIHPSVSATLQGGCHGSSPIHIDLLKDRGLSKVDEMF